MKKKGTLSKGPEPFLKQDYENLLPTLEALREEVSFVLRDALSAEQIKVHAVESRVKEFASWSKKISEKVPGQPQEIEDMVGARVVCLFKSDIAQLDAIICDKFDLIGRDDKIQGSNDSFGYMSVHYICKMKGEYTGPRYNRIKDVKFEVQVRTICMHAWAAVSHYLDYKSEWDIPDHLKKGLNALSGLFYVADEQYERLYDARQESRAQADLNANLEQSLDVNVNLDTVTAYISKKYPERRSSGFSEVSNLVFELIEGGYNTISKLENAVSPVAGQLREDEIKTIRRQNERNDPFYSQAGAIRISLSLVDPDFKKIMKDSAQKISRSPVDPLEDNELSI